MSIAVWSILVVDDEPTFRKVLRKSLSAAGHNVDEASSGGDAVDMLSQSPFQFVLLDLNMPGMGGITTCRMIRSILPRTGIVVLSVRDAEEDRVVALDAGADDYLTKPFGLSELIARLHAIHRRIQIVKEEEPEVLKAGALQMDMQGHSVWLAGEAKRLKREATGSGLELVPKGLMAFLPTFLFLVLLMTAFMSFSHGTQDVYPTFLSVTAGLSPETIGVIGVLYGLGSIAGVVHTIPPPDFHELPENVFGSVAIQRQRCAPVFASKAATNPRKAHSPPALPTTIMPS